MLKNQLLQQAQAKVEAGIKDRASFDKIVKAGTKVIYDKGVFAQLTKGLAESKDPVADVARGIVGVLGLLAQKARGTMPKAVMAQAGMALLLDALDFLEQAGLVQIDAGMLSKATSAYVDHLLPSAGLPPDKMQSMLESTKATMADPQRMAEYKQSIGGAK